LEHLIDDASDLGDRSTNFPPSRLEIRFPSIGRKRAGPFLKKRQEQRSSPRRLVLLSALIVSPDFERVIACRVEDVSRGGARLHVSEWLLLPRQFWLIAMQSGLAYPARTVWRRFPSAGVALSDPLQDPITDAARSLRPFWEAVAR
jgi:hypothetical protein